MTCWFCHLFPPKRCKLSVGSLANSQQWRHKGSFKLVFLVCKHSLSLCGDTFHQQRPYLKISIISSAQKDKARMISLPVSCQTYLSQDIFVQSKHDVIHSAVVFWAVTFVCDIYDLLWLPHTYTHRHTLLLSFFCAFHSEATQRHSEAQQLFPAVTLGQKAYMLSYNLTHTCNKEVTPSGLTSALFLGI